MKKHLIILLFCAIPLTVHAAEMLNTKDSFQLARAVKLGRSSSESSMLSREFLPGTGGGTTFCPANCAQCDGSGNCTRCKTGYLLSGGQCVTCPTGHTCDGTENTGCDSGYYSYNGSCKICPAHYASCSGSNVTCQAGYYRTENNGYSCKICEAGYYSSVGATSCTKCSSGNYASGTGNASCISCSEITISGGAGLCTACTISGTCTSIECNSGYELNTAGNACVEEPKTCMALATKNNSNVIAATDASSFSAALSSDKSIILVDGDISGLSTAALGSKKLVGPKYFSDIALCQAQATPTATFASSANLTISGGEINQLNLTFTMEDKTKDAVSGSGTIKDASITTKLNKSVVSASGKITLAGTVTLNNQQVDGDNYANTYILTTQGGSVEITGKTTLSGTADYGLGLGSKTTATVSSTGTLVLNMPEVFVGIDLENNSTFTANGPVKFDANARSAIGYISVEKAVINLNASGNYIKTSYSGLMQTHGDINIKGSTTIECVRTASNNCESCGCKAIDSHETYSNSVNSVTINAPVTLVNFNKSQGTTYPTTSGDTILSVVGGTLKINSTIESKAGYGKVLINGETMNMSSSGAILGASYLYGRGSSFSVSAGAKLKLGGICKKATTSGTLSSVTYDNAIKTPVSPFTGGC